MVDDPHLIRRAQQGERDAVAALYRQYHAAIYRYIAYRVGDTGAADDLTADVFVAMVKHIGSYEDRGRPFLAWLYTIAGNTLKMHYRRGPAQASKALPEGLVDQAAGPDEQAQRRLTQELLLATLPRLTEPQRQVILLKFSEGLSNREIAAIMSKNEGAVRILQHRALQALRALLAEAVEPDAV